MLLLRSTSKGERTLKINMFDGNYSYGFISDTAINRVRRRRVVSGRALLGATVFFPPRRNAVYNVSGYACGSCRQGGAAGGESKKKKNRKRKEEEQRP